MGTLGDNNFIPVYGWMLNLNLKPLEVMILAIINNFEQSGNEYTGSAGYIVETLHVAKSTTITALNNLVKKGHLSKQASKGRSVSIYRINRPKIGQLPTENRTVNRPKIGHYNNIYNNKSNNKYKNTSSSYKKEADTEYRDNTQKEAAAGVQKLEQRFQDNDFAEVVDCFSNNIHSLSGQIEAESLGELFDKYGKGWLMDAIKEAVMNNGRSVKYIKAILERWDRQGKGSAKQRPGTRQYTAEEIPF